MTGSRLSQLGNWLLAFTFLIAVGPANARLPEQERKATLSDKEMRGTVLDVTEQKCEDCSVVGVRATVRWEDKRVVELRIAPKSYLEMCNFRLSAGDVIDVTGSRMREGSVDVVIARSIRRGNENLTLRDSAGKPMWESHRCSRCRY
ncbi:MAG: hypothetical protein ACKV22_10070 [Bryobacteraceae bacterium]